MTTTITTRTPSDAATPPDIHGHEKDAKEGKGSWTGPALIFLSEGGSRDDG